jgi:hypothetical protein
MNLHVIVTYGSDDTADSIKKTYRNGTFKKRFTFINRIISKRKYLEYASEDVHFVELIYMLLSLTVQLIRADSIKKTYRNEAF